MRIPAALLAGAAVQFHVTDGRRDNLLIEGHSTAYEAQQDFPYGYDIDCRISMKQAPKAADRLNDAGSLRRRRLSAAAALYGLVSTMGRAAIRLRLQASSRYWTITT